MGGDQGTPDLLTYDEVCDRLRVGRRTVERLIRRGELTKVKAGAKSTRITAASYAEFIARGGVPA